MPPRKKQMTSDPVAEVSTRTRRGRPPSKKARNLEKKVEELDIADFEEGAFQDGGDSQKRMRKGKTSVARYSIIAI